MKKYTLTFESQHDMLLLLPTIAYMSESEVFPDTPTRFWNNHPIIKTQALLFAWLHWGIALKRITNLTEEVTNERLKKLELYSTIELEQELVNRRDG